ncbi:hypothetical protein [Hyalangium gracile]|nr:hypothetical protein [Hyalangium gracile]
MNLISIADEIIAMLAADANATVKVSHRDPCLAGAFSTPQGAWGL